MGTRGMRPMRLATAKTASSWSAAAIGRAATLALHDELALAPKPGLVSFVDSGSHDDMDAHTFMRSLFALRRYFVRIAELGADHAPFADLQECGLAAEARMLAATSGINTHRGAIFALGLLCAAVAAAQSDGGAISPASVREALQRYWGDALAKRCEQSSRLPGAVAARRYGLRSASEEAALGLPVLFETAVPAWTRAVGQGLGGTRLRVQVFFAILAVLDDANLAHRGGIDGLHFARGRGQAFLAAGGAMHDTGLDEAWAIHRAFVARRLSPGGCADMLSCACFLHRIGLIG